MVEQFAVAEGTAFISGDGVSQPEGFLAHPDIAEVNGGHASLVQADGLIDMYYTLPEIYAAAATWIMRRSTVGEVRKLKDSSDQYLWQPGIAGSAPNTILGAPYAEAPGMPAVAANAFPIALGAWSKGYLIVDRLAIGLLRDEYTQAKKGVVEFIARKRVGGQVVLAEAILKQKIAV
jgi:HK97 family phage major capsid protein